MHKKIVSALLSLILTVSLFTLSLPQIGYAQTTTAQLQTPPDLQTGLKTIEEKVEKRRNELGIPGMSLVIVHDGQVIFVKGFGYKDFEKKVPVTTDTQFAIGSASKAFTGLSVLMSVDEGKVSLDDSPKKVLPYFKMNDPDADKNITIRDLLSHSSGLNRTDLAMITGKLNRQELIQVAGEAKATAKLREKFQYQNLMYTAAGEVVASVQKMPWEEFVPERIFKPLGMTNSTMTIKQMKKAKDYSYGYEYNFDTKQTRRLPFRPIDAVAPAGSINSNANDMARWLKFILSGGMADGKRVVSERSFEEWLKPQMKMGGKNAYGFGWFLQDWNGLKVVQHGGNIDGFNSMVAMIPEKKLGFVMLTNVTSSPLGGELMPMVWENILGKPAKSAPAAPLAAGGNGSNAARELIGSYSPANAPVTIDIKQDGDKVTLNVPGQQPYTLVEKAKDLFAAPPLPDEFSVKAKRDADGKVTSIIMVQPQGEVELKRVEKKASEEPKISVDELMAKAIESAGGEAAWRKLTSRVTVTNIDLVHQGVKGTITSYAKASNKTAAETTLTALGRVIAKGYEYFDGTNGEETVTFSPTEKYSGKKLEDIRLNADFYAPLDWKTNYKNIVITRMAKVDGEDCYVVEFTPEKGTKVTEYYSAKSYLMLKREGVVVSSTSDVSLPYSTIFSDYRDVDGIKLPFKYVTSNISMGDTISTVVSVKHNVEIKDKVFTPHKVKVK